MGEIKLEDTGVCPIVGDTLADLLLGRFSVNDIMKAVKTLYELIKAQLDGLE